MPEPYPCQRKDLKKNSYDFDGPIKPLCTSCKTKDCENPIEWTEISYLGIKYKHRVWKRGDKISLVVDCVGYTTSEGPEGKKLQLGRDLAAQQSQLQEPEPPAK